jgi:hypothetical protein
MDKNKEISVSVVITILNGRLNGFKKVSQQIAKEEAAQVCFVLIDDAANAVNYWLPNSGKRRQCSCWNKIWRVLWRQS